MIDLCRAAVEAGIGVSQGGRVCHAPTPRPTSPSTPHTLVAGHALTSVAVPKHLNRILVFKNRREKGN